MNLINKLVFAILLTYGISFSNVGAQTDNMQIIQNGKTTSTLANPIFIQTVDIPAGTFFKFNQIKTK